MDEFTKEALKPANDSAVASHSLSDVEHSNKNYSVKFHMKKSPSL